MAARFLAGARFKDGEDGRERIRDLTLSRVEADVQLAVDLIDWLLEPMPNKRPTIDQVRRHKFLYPLDGHTHAEIVYHDTVMQKWGAELKLVVAEARARAEAVVEEDCIRYNSEFAQIKSELSDVDAHREDEGLQAFRFVGHALLLADVLQSPQQLLIGQPREP